jgi:glucokinase
MATGGVYFCGGVAPRVLDTAGFEPVLSAFFDKGRMRKVLEGMPVYLVHDGNLALKGAAHTAIGLSEGV